MEAQVYVEPQVTIGLLSEYADKLRSLSELCIKYHRRKLIMEGLYYSFSIASFVLFILLIDDLSETMNGPGDSLFFFRKNVLAIAAVSMILVITCLFIVGKIKSTETAYTLLLQKNLGSLYERLALQVKKYSQYLEHRENDKYREGELDLRLTDAEGALSLAEEALKVSLGREAWKAFERRSMRRFEPIPVHEERP